MVILKAVSLFPQLLVIGLILINIKLNNLVIFNVRSQLDLTKSNF
jgi:hypothetical protein